jgi:phage baseplate assembly protein W
VDNNSRTDNRQKAFLGSGWAFPVKFSEGNLQLNMTMYEANINDSIDLILMTRQGERIMEAQFGSGLQQFFFRKMDETLKGELSDAVKTSLLNNEPRIKVIAVTVSYADPVNGLVTIGIDYVYNQTNTRHNYVFPFHLTEGTNLG